MGLRVGLEVGGRRGGIEVGLGGVNGMGCEGG